MGKFNFSDLDKEEQYKEEPRFETKSGKQQNETYLEMLDGQIEAVRFCEGYGSETEKELRKEKIEALKERTKGIQKGMDKSTPIKNVDAGAPFNVVAKKLEKDGR